MDTQVVPLGFAIQRHNITRLAEKSVGSKVLMIAVKGDDEFMTALPLLTQNRQIPGSMAEYIKSLRKPDSRGRRRPVVIAGSGVDKLLMAFTQACNGDIMTGLSRKQVARLFGVESTDPRVQKAGQALGDLFEQTLGLRVKWHKKRLRLVTARQIQEEQKYHEKRIAGMLQRREKDQDYLRARQAIEKSTSSYQLSFFELEDEMLYDAA